MKEEAKWMLYIPPDLAYGERGNSGKKGMIIIGPNQTLIFEIDLISIQP
jgi:FKBP-type peptidyl-prolyl cis-trans isomerase FklB